MTRTMKVTFFLSAILGIAVGGRLGYSQGAEVSESMRSAEPIGAGLAVSEFAARQFRYADVDHARQAVQLEISIRTQLTVVKRDAAADGQLGLAYVRLAMVEEAAGNKFAERLALKQARAWLPRRPGQEASDEQLKDFLKRLDRAEIGTTIAPKTTSDGDSPPHSSLE